MITLNDQHLRALRRSVGFVSSGISKTMTPRMREAIEHDIKLIKEVQDYVIQQIIEPGLPMAAQTIDVGEIGENHGDTN